METKNKVEKPTEIKPSANKLRLNKKFQQFFLEKIVYKAHIVSTNAISVVKA